MVEIGPTVLKITSIKTSNLLDLVISEIYRYTDIQVTCYMINHKTVYSILLQSTQLQNGYIA